MSIRIEITGNDAQEIAQSILQMAFMIAPKLAGVPEQPPAEAVTADTVQPARRPGRPKKTDAPVIEHEEKKEPENVHAGSGGSGGAEVPAGVSGTEGGAEPAGSPAADDAPAEVDAVAADEKAAPKDIVDPIRAHVINDYLNVVTDSLPTRKDLYSELLNEFGLTAITALKPSQVEAFKAAVDAKIAAAVTGK